MADAALVASGDLIRHNHLSTNNNHNFTLIAWRVLPRTLRNSTECSRHHNTADPCGKNTNQKPSLARGRKSVSYVFQPPPPPPLSNLEVWMVESGRSDGSQCDTGLPGKTRGGGASARYCWLLTKPNINSQWIHTACSRRPPAPTATNCRAGAYTSKKRGRVFVLPISKKRGIKTALSSSRVL